MSTNNIPRVIAVNDLSGYGRVSLTEALPVLSAMGVEACPLPTAILSTHTYKFENYTFLDLTDEMEKIISHWKELSLSFDAISTGYMGSARQIELVSDYIMYLKKVNPDFLTVIDPVLGDNALHSVETVFYERMSGIIESMRRFVTLADIITPNVTEACLLLKKDFSADYISEQAALEYLKALTDMGPRAAVITSIMTASDRMSIGVYDKDTDFFEMIDCSYVARPFHGTGDIYTAALTGGLVKGMSVRNAARCAASFVRKAIEETVRLNNMPIEKGSAFESVLADFFSSGSPEMNSFKNRNDNQA